MKLLCSKSLKSHFSGSPVTDIKRAREFYEGVAGLKPAMNPGAVG